ncbi:MAG: hypothetical protein K2Y51_26055 [Gammaproteobacteria bacterium]|nr:hypothetical protein [Gammaproteobacteria bacterium]
MSQLRKIEPIDRIDLVGFTLSVGMAAEVTDLERVRGCVMATHALLRRPVLLSPVVDDATIARSVVAEIRTRLEGQRDAARLVELDEEGPRIQEWLTGQFRYGREKLPSFVRGYASEVRRKLGARVPA